MNFRFGLSNLHALLLAAAMLAFGSNAAMAAVTLSVSGEIISGANSGSTDLTLAGAGDMVMININVDNPDNTIAGATFSASSTDDLANLTFVDGKTAATWFNESTGKAYGNPVGGMANIRGEDGGVSGSYTSWVLPLNVTANQIINDAVQFFSGADPGAPKVGTGDLDLGILEGNTIPGGATDVGFVDNAGGVNGSAGAFHAQLFFTVVSGQTQLDIGKGPNDGLVSAAGDEILVPTEILVPEPAGVALGLAAIASAFAVTGIRRRT